MQKGRKAHLRGTLSVVKVTSIEHLVRELHLESVLIRGAFYFPDYLVIRYIFEPMVWGIIDLLKE